MSVCLKTGCDRGRHPGGHGENPEPGGCVMCRRCCTRETEWLTGTDLEARMTALIDGGRPVTAEQVRDHLSGFVRPDAPAGRVEATCEVIARRVNKLLDGSYQPARRTVNYRRFPGAWWGDTFLSEPFTPCERCGRLFIWFPERPRRCLRDGCRPER